LYLVFRVFRVIRGAAFEFDIETGCGFWSQPTGAVRHSCDVTEGHKLFAPILVTWYCFSMRVIALSTLRTYWENHPDSRQQLQAWYEDARHALWQSPTDIKSVYRNASIIANNRVVFNIKGNDYRLIVAVNYKFGIIYIRFVGDHKGYDRIDAATV